MVFEFCGVLHILFKVTHIYLAVLCYGKNVYFPVNKYRFKKVKWEFHKTKKINKKKHDKLICSVFSIVLYEKHILFAIDTDKKKNLVHRDNI